MAKEGASIKQLRGANKSAITRATQDLDDFLNTTTLAGAMGKKSAIEKALKKVADYDEQLLSTITEANELDKTADEAIAYMTTVETVLAKINDRIASLKVSNSSSNIKLPQLQLTRFSGCPTEWNSFWDLFETSVHNRSDLSNIQKLTYLKGQLDGPAKQLLEGFSLEAANYATCVDLLKKSYGSTDVIKATHIQSLVELSPPSFNLGELADFRATFECHIRSLSNLNLTLDEFYCVLLMNKLPDRMREIVKRAAGEDWLNYDVFCRSFQTELDNISSTIADSVEEKHKATASFVVKMDDGKTDQSKIGKDTECTLCSKLGHLWYRCYDYPTPEAKVKRARGKRLCFTCLSNDHWASECKVQLKPCIYCSGRHYHQLCLKRTRGVPQFQRGNSGANKSTPSSRNEGARDGVKTMVVSAQHKSCTSVLSTIKLPLIGRGKRKVECRAFLDQGSQVSFIRRSVLEGVRYEKLGSETLRLRTYHQVESDNVYDLVRVHFPYKGLIVPIECFVDEVLPEGTVYKGLDKHVFKFKRQGLMLADDYLDPRPFDLLIGLDNYYKLVHPGFRHQGDLVLIPTKFGYALSGKYSNHPAQVSSVQIVTVLKLTASPLLDEVEINCGDRNNDLAKVWDLDSVGIGSGDHEKESSEVLQHFADTVRFRSEDNQYVVRLPWKRSPESLPTNYGLAVGRLRNLQRKFRKDEKLLTNYSKVIQEQESKGFIERVPEHQLNRDIPCHYLSHHGITKDSNTTPTRVVFDCSARTGKGVLSLNDCLYTGPSLVSDLCQILLRFRLDEYVAVSDIEKAFLQIQIHEEDRDYTRFLWPVDPCDPQSELIVFRFKVVLFGATCSQFLLNATILSHLASFHDSNIIQRGLYIDNLQIHSPSENELIQLYWRSHQMFSSAHLFLREWSTNSSKLSDQIAFDGMAAALPLVKVLGMLWDPVADDVKIQPCLDDVDLDKLPTKREVLSQFASVFDPMGMLLPTTIRTRIYLQELWKIKLDWDHQIPEGLSTQWREIVSDLRKVSNMQFDRRLVNSASVCQLHAFADASNKAYGSCVYIVCGTVSRLVMARARVAPMRGLTVPKLELTAALVAARLIKFVYQAFEVELNLDGIYLWSDSQIVLHWLRSQKSLPVFMKNRVDEIHSLLPDVVYRYVPTDQNPADILSRGVSAEGLSGSSLWWQGPSWLPFIKKWPLWKVTTGDSEISVKDGEYSEIPVHVIVQGPPTVFEWDRYGTYDKLLHVAAWVNRFCGKLKCSEDNDGAYLTISELRKAELLILQSVQREMFYDEIMKCEQNGQNHLICQLGLYIGPDGLLHCKGRLKHAALPEGTKHPILLPSKHKVTTLLIERVHRAGCHYGVNYVVTMLRQHWWIPKMRQCVKRVVSKCITCCKLQTRSFPALRAPDLPDFRVNRVDPFAITGVDYTGALSIKGTPESKVYIVLFTCAVTRAVHLELVRDLSAISFLQALRRFCGRRSCPKMLLSDNATYFTSVAKHLSDIMNVTDVTNYLSGIKCQWRFIPARAPWFGAIWERCIGIIKMGLRKVLGRALVSYDELLTLITELEAVVNDRPLTYASGALNEPEALTPSQLIYGRQIKSLPLFTEQDRIDDPEFVSRQRAGNMLNERYDYVVKLRNDLWKRWSTEYLTFLRQSNQSNLRDGKWPSEGEVVLIHDDGPRLFWKLGIITKLFRGSDGQSRVAQLRTGHGTTTRPIVKLYPLEINCEESWSHNVSDMTGEQSVDSTARSIRQSAQAARSDWQSKIRAGQL